jgi:hypothetical protein
MRVKGPRQEGGGVEKECALGATNLAFLAWPMF